MDFEKFVNEQIELVEARHQRDHPLLGRSNVSHKLIDKDKSVAAFVLYEHIDTDRCTPHGSGWLGDQYRNSIWLVKGELDAHRIYEDHAWLKQSGASGRQCDIRLHELSEGGIVASLYRSFNGDMLMKKSIIEFDGTINDLPSKSALKPSNSSGYKL